MEFGTKTCRYRACMYRYYVDLHKSCLLALTSVDGIYGMYPLNYIPSTNAEQPCYSYKQPRASRTCLLPAAMSPVACLKGRRDCMNDPYIVKMLTFIVSPF